MEITPSGQACGATVRGVDLSAPLDTDTAAAIRSAWLEHHVLAFPDQTYPDPELPLISARFGLWSVTTSTLLP